ncbi:DUF4245 family protein [Glycomyces algeriensis]|uniref:DUF4245 domain-containing protein n=1 Tax=Glycomyces algeriensis TaxID=256037 RepID=A0A9W6G7S2_9ACTN|nr:DUF4245 family protein [Glycomyces algeriensis]MDA1366031.1 DUF4245 family protein [Glycomyces algeriensis]MDR7349202.1 hypothetical protein [Glycomyces algeriensis]GLI41902.1 hypothetical protein GALLR39Z86_17520 [Glycomyces algeriensis]
MSTEEVKVEAGVAGGAVDGSAVEGGTVESGTAEGGSAEGTAEAPAPGVERDEVENEAVANATAAKSARPKQRRMRDMAMSMAVLLVPIGLFYVGWQWLAADRQVSVVDTSANYSTAASLGLAVIEPELGGEWKAISTDLAVEGETVTLRTGYYSPEGNGLQLSETNGTALDVNENLSGAGSSVESAGIQWAAYESDNGETWVAEIGGETVVLSAEPDGVGDLPELAEGVAEAAGA